jgi:hypothetical protein
VYFVTVGLQYTKYLRYLLPLLPVLYILAACAWWRVLEKRPVVFGAATGVVLLASLVYSLAFVQMYTREHPWLDISRQIYEKLPRGAVLTVEEWDDAMPTMIRYENGERRGAEYAQIALPMYDEDTDEKRATLVNALVDADAVVLASQRLYGSIGKLPTRYPMTNRYYEKLFSGELGFEPTLRSRNDIQLAGLVIRDDPFAGLAFGLEDDLGAWIWGFADESFSVYDHPQPIVFEKVRELSAEELDAALKPLTP